MWRFLLLVLLVVGRQSPCGAETTGTAQYPYPELPFEEVQLRPPPRQIVGNGMSVGVRWEIPGCGAGDVPVEVVVRSEHEYAAFVENMYRTSYRDYLRSVPQLPGMVGSGPRYGFEEFVQRCNVYPRIPLRKKTLLSRVVRGRHCEAPRFEQHVYRDDAGRQVLWVVTVTGAVRSTTETCFGGFRLWITVPRVPEEYQVRMVEEDLTLGEPVTDVP